MISCGNRHIRQLQQEGCRAVFRAPGARFRNAYGCTLPQFPLLAARSLPSQQQPPQQGPDHNSRPHSTLPAAHSARGRAGQSMARVVSSSCCAAEEVGAAGLVNPPCQHGASQGSSGPLATVRAA